jgi:hypothetical protein
VLAAAHPEYEFRIEITTGTSAPPIGTIKIKPSRTPPDNTKKKQEGFAVSTGDSLMFGGIRMGNRRFRALRPNFA